MSIGRIAGQGTAGEGLLLALRESLLRSGPWAKDRHYFIPNLFVAAVIVSLTVTC